MGGLPREGDVLDCAAQDSFCAAGVDRFSHQPRCCASVCQTQVRVRNHLMRDQKLLLFFAFLSLDLRKMNSDLRQPALLMQ